MSGQWRVTFFVVYAHPKDYPDCYVIREHVAQNDGVVVACKDVHTFPTLGEARRWCRTRNLYCLERHTLDDPVIVEVWV